MKKHTVVPAIGEKKLSLEDKIEKAQQKVDAIKEQLRRESAKLMSLENQKIIKDSSKSGALKRLILSHPPCDCKIGNGVFAILITILTLPYHHKGRKKLTYLFPFTEKGYQGKSGDCLLAGHISFTPSEQAILKKYGISWNHSMYGSIRGH